jgi:hypothetical protein
VFPAVPVVARAGRPIDVDALRKAADGDRRLMVDAIGVAIADVLPESYRGCTATGTRRDTASKET